jgi:DNA-binding NtrC family response regulator
VRTTAAAAILIADDAALLRRFMRRVLEAEGHRVHEAADGEQTLGALRLDRAGIGVVVLDLGMPPYGALEHVKRVLELRPDVRLVVTSGLPPDPEVCALLRRRRVAFLQKPFAAEALSRAVSGDASAGGSR